MTNILFIHQSADLYGSDKTLLLLLTKLNKSRFNPIVVIPVDGPLREELEQRNIKVIIAPVLKIYRKMFTPKNIFLFFKQIKKGVATLDKLNDEYNFDIVYSNTLAVLLGMFYAKKRKIKHIWHVHEIIVHPKIIAYIFPKLLNKYADVVVCNSKATMDNLISRQKKLAIKAQVIHNGLKPLNDDYVKISREELGFEKNDFIITLIGRINRLKGHKWLLNTYIDNFKSNKNIKLLFVGSPVLGQEYYLEEIEEIIKEKNLNEFVKILGFKKDLRPILNLTDVLAVPSTEAESFGLVALEAMLAKKPVIGSNHGGLTEIIIDNKTGFLIEPNNENELSKAIESLIKNKDLRTQFGQNGYQRAVAEFSVDKYINNFEKLFEEMVPNKN
ncbi:MAG TPA: glycosyltransferase family 4 protein [Flavobacterium sp.]|uniref:glycosyltransferase family 4 protein n=1 Tax=Flavobacterium sp. TaxID=239 RepID=UPI002C856209|nr:glycosyltransferase family 4 protein [Flavobacterium sp.]HNP31930.1 glycosyltransferase family 4 protein [Flavobacterium sp.]